MDGPDEDCRATVRFQHAWATRSQIHIEGHTGGCHEAAAQDAAAVALAGRGMWTNSWTNFC